MSNLPACSQFSLPLIVCFAEPVLLDTNVQITSAQWNHNGSVIAIVGSSQDEATNVVHLYSPLGEVSGLPANIHSSYLSVDFL